jgi:glycosyltransferase involved in cell wall biosynthesis
MRVLQIIPGRLFGGVESTHITLARFRHLCPALITEVAVCFEGRVSQELRTLGVPVHVLGQTRVRFPLTVWRARRKLRALLRKCAFDVVVCHMPWVQAIFGPVVRSEGLPLAFGAHGPATGCHRIEQWAAITPPDLVISVSRFLAANVRELYPGIPAEVVYNPMPPLPSLSCSDRLDIRAELKNPPEAVVIVQVGRLEKGKGHEVCLKALHLLRDLPAWQCWQIGGPQTAEEKRYFETLRELTFTLGIEERVQFLGQRCDVDRLLLAADIYCQPNDTCVEGLGNTFIEAISAGLPIVTTRLGGIPEVVDESCGFLLAPGDVPGAASALKKLIEDPELRARLGAGGRTRLQKTFTPAAQIPRLLEALTKAMRPVV